MGKPRNHDLPIVWAMVFSDKDQDQDLETRGIADDVKNLQCTLQADSNSDEEVNAGIIVAMDAPTKVLQTGNFHQTLTPILRIDRILEKFVLQGLKSNMNVHPKVLVKRGTEPKEKNASPSLPILSATLVWGSKHVRLDAVEKLAEWLDNNQDSLHAKLGKGAMILNAVGVIVWDTESDGVGGTHTLALTREWGFRNLATGSVVSTKLLRCTFKLRTKPGAVFSKILLRVDTISHDSYLTTIMKELKSFMLLPHS
ncbi:hypothetical protein BC830DRAFT_1080884 [Chytriomyces sp. MP71]|nr:hypothetical protein BC830DRAFT_1080884 [Chytriomyces sp. MP71]